LEKITARIARIGAQPELLEQLARDVGAAIAAGERDALERIARELAVHAPHRVRGDNGSDRDYWAGFAAAMATLIAAERASSEKREQREAALRQLTGETAQAAVELLAEDPMTGAELAARLGVTPGAASKVLAQLRGAGLARTLGGEPYPKRGARKPHVLTPLGSWAQGELRRRRGEQGRAALGLVADAG
jgi:DNA-binding transcriptional ArsR family regulator